MSTIKSPISLLQEILIKEKKVPIYQEQLSDIPQFPFKCMVTFGTITASGYAHTKKEAKQNCAQEALLKIGSLTSYKNIIFSKHTVFAPNRINYIGKLNEFASGRHLGYPIYCDKLSINGQSVVECSFQGLKTEGRGLNKMNAKQEASRLMLQRKISNMTNIKTPISLLQEVLIQQRKVPIYQEQPSDLPQFPFKCTVTFDSTTTCGYAHTKKEAKQNCAQEALLKIGVGSSTSYNINNNSSSKCTVASTDNINYTGRLNEFASGNQVPYATYSDKLPVNGLFVVECSFQGLKTEGLGTHKKGAKQESSKLMLQRLKQEDKLIFQKDFSSVENNENINLIIDKYEEMSINTNENTSATSLDFLLPQIQDKCNIFCIDELIEKLKELGHVCTLEVFQKNPYIMVLKSDKTFCVMGHGKTKEEATDNLIVNCNILLFC